MSWTILADGRAFDDSLQVLSVSVTKAVNRIASAQIVLIDGDMAAGDFPISSSETLRPGVEIEIRAGYGHQTSTIFKGLIVRHSIRVTGQNDTRLIVDCQDKAMKMTLGRKNASYLEQSDSDIISSVIGSHGLSSAVDATAVVLKELTQYLASDWDFVLMRAEANGLIVLVDDGALTVREPIPSGATPVLAVTYGNDLMEFHGEIDARTQYSAVKGACWDPDQRTVTGATTAAMTVTTQGNLTSATLAGVGDLSEFRLQTSVPLDPAALQAWTRTQQIKAGLARVRGRVKFAGSSKAEPGTLITLNGVGTRFSGDAFIGAVRHEIARGEWVTEAELGLDPEWIAERRDLAAPAAGGLLPPVHGLHVGVVAKLDADPEGQYRVQVSIPVMEAATSTVWARVLQFHASNGFGAFFLPEVGDEVVLGYFNSDPNHPVILGSLCSKNRRPAHTLAAKNSTKAIVTRTKMKVEFDEDNKVVTITTPANNKVVLNDSDRSILLSDQNSNTVKLSPSGIQMDSPKDIKIKAVGAITIDAAQRIAIKSSGGDVAVSALNITNDATVAFTGKGAARAELSSAGQTAVKGAVVMIN